MGNYVAKADVLEQLPEEFLIQLTDDEAIGAVNDARVDAAIADAEGEADGYLATRYDVPLAPVPAVVRKFTVDIAVYNLFCRRDTVPPDRDKRYENAVKFFSSVAKGVVSLGAGAPEPANQEAGGTDMTGSSRVFTRDKMEGL